MNPEIYKQAVKLVKEIEKAQGKFILSDKYLYKVASEETREEYFLKMYKLIKELIA